MNPDTIADTTSDSLLPSITVITPVLNAAQTLGDCLTSIEKQTLPYQHIIVDGGSTDGTLDIIHSRSTHGRIVITEPDRGLYDAINKGLKHATGEIVGILNADDFYTEASVFEAVARCFMDQNVDGCYGDLEYVDRKNSSKVVRRWRSGHYNPRRFYNGWMPPHPTFFLLRSFYEKYSTYRLDMGTAADYELMLRMLLKHRAKVAYLQGTMVRMRNQGVSNNSLLNRLKANRNDRRAWRVNGLTPLPWTLIAKPMTKVSQWF